ncbi:hypothetical protein OHB36_28680 [Streptomyces sp. NBC_00320]|uniref:hypothetical protein n=1 Tax=unclassified Streptomyces TaxID=2593676 RepID=UPI0022564272|nr:hypothetical protein [Streptomyces sp. NBC_00320]MCX5150686.1 hypothetical protein [Streptomyces sp. NBC_00320]
MTGDFADLSCQFDTGRAAADQREREPSLPFPGICRRFGHLERPVDPPTDVQCVVQRLHAGRARQLVMPEGRLAHADRAGFDNHVGGFGRAIWTSDRTPEAHW